MAFSTIAVFIIITIAATNEVIGSVSTVSFNKQ